MTESHNEHPSISPQQSELFEATVKQVEGLGYRGDLLRRDYQFGDWFSPETPLRRVPAAAFGRTPVAYDSACFALLLANGKSGRNLISDYRALGAPLAFEVREDCVVQWKVGRSPETTEERLRILPGALDRIFEDHRNDWAAQAVLRAKNVGFDLGPRQLDFIDLGLIPALESQIKGKLDRLLREVVKEAVRGYHDSLNQAPDLRALFRLVFRVLAVKVLHDRRVASFKVLPEPANVRIALEAVAEYYDDSEPLLQDKPTQIFLAEKIWGQADFQNLSVEVLAYIYENTLVDESVRKELGTHSTPHSIARYIVHRLPVHEIPLDERRVMEPFCGHAIFLVSALQRLRELLPPDMDHQEKHRYFVRMLNGFELDAFALEVGKMCLMLADFPNHNGWRLKNEDVFLSKTFTPVLRRARIVLCNPPFENFSTTERARYPDLRSVKKPAEILCRVLRHLASDGMLGFVLPRSFVDGPGYREIRKILAERYCEAELVLLPDKVFEHSDVETALLIAKRASTEGRHRLSVTLTEVKDSDRGGFLGYFDYTRRDSEILTLERASRSLSVIALGDAWKHLTGNPKLGDMAEIHRGVEWKAPFDSAKYLSPIAKPGFKRGLSTAAGNFFSFLTPPTEYLCVRPDCQRGGAFNLPWDSPKIVMNAVRVSRGPWCVAAFADESGLLCSQSFTCLWPFKGDWTVKSLAAVLNGPVANAFIATRERKIHIRKSTLEGVPLPKLRSFEIESIDRLVDEFALLLLDDSGPENSLRSSSQAETAREILLKIDAQILRGYNLPPRIERQLLDSFYKKPRPVPLDFDGYYASNFTPYLPLWMYISSELRDCTAKQLIKVAPRITDAALVDALEEVE